MARIARLVIRHRLLVVGAWIVLTLVGAFSTTRLADRWFQSFSIPGYSAYEANQRTLKLFGSGEQAPLVAVFTSPSKDVTRVDGIRRAIDATAHVVRGSRTGSWFETHSDMYLSPDKHTMVATIYPPGNATFSRFPPTEAARAALKKATPKGVTSHLTGRDPIFQSQGGETGPGVLTETLLGATGALIILLFVFGTLPAIAMPLAMAASSILTTFACVYALTYVTDVSIIVQFLVALVGLGVSIDYALVMIFRFREELASGRPTDEALVETMTHAGRSVIISGSTVAIGLLSMIILPLPFIRSIGIGGMLIPAVSVLASITLLPALLALLGPRINSVRVLPRRLVEGSDVEAGFWNAWARFVVRRPIVTAATGLSIVAVLLVFGVQLNPSEAQAKDLPGGGDAINGRAALTAAGISAGVYKPFEILVEGDVTPAALDRVESAVESTPGVIGATAPPQWRTQNAALVEAIPAHDGAAKDVRPVISNLQHDVLPAVASDTGLRVTLGGNAPEERDFVHAVYGNFPWVLLFVIVLTFILLTRAFRSIILPLKAVILNLVSLGAAYGIVVFIFQKGYGAEEIWNVPATE